MTGEMSDEQNVTSDGGRHPGAEKEALMKFKRTSPVPAGHCPEPVVEIGNYSYQSHRVEWERAIRWSDDGDFCSFRTRGMSGWMGWGETQYDGARIVAERGGLIMANNADLRLPWTVAPLEGKYYGTQILDATGDVVAEFWDHSVESAPSEREKASFGDWTEDAWAEHCCDSHWESERDYLRAKAIVDAMNATLAAA
jgi:hypothetical protein